MPATAHHARPDPNPWPLAPRYRGRFLGMTPAAVHVFYGATAMFVALSALVMVAVLR